MNMDESISQTKHYEFLGKEGLEYLHTCEPAVIHRDIKGSNILIGDGALVQKSSKIFKNLEKMEEGRSSCS